MSDIPSEWLWIVIVSFVISFFLAFGIGANDVANSFGTSVGAKVLTLFKACILATIFEILGSVLIGYRVSDTIRKGIIDVNPYNNSETLLLMGNLSALTGSCIWLFLATLLSLPVSATHSIVGATIGFSLVAKGAEGVNWSKLGLIIASWFISPVMAGSISAALFWTIRKLVLSKAKPLEPGLKLLPLFYGVTILINAISVFLDGSELLQFNKIPLYGTFILSFGLALLTALGIRVLVVPWMRKKIEERETVEHPEENGKPCVNFNQEIEVAAKPKVTVTDTSFNVEADCGDRQQMLLGNGNGLIVAEEAVVHTYGSTIKNETVEVADSTTALMAASDLSQANEETVTITTKFKGRKYSKDKRCHSREAITDHPQTTSLFSFLQVLTAIFGAFAHGGNDVSNAIGPLVAVWVISNEHNVAQKAPTPIWILIYGGIGISLGLCILGRRVIKTMGEDLSKITPSSGFCIELGAAFTVLVASYVGIPISTTHCKVGSIVFVGRVRSNDNVDWSLFRNIILAWVVTLPASGLLSALMMFLLKEFAL
ncbi:hypothetical protein BsWGS_24464 [Bradybaena similaris]